MPAASRVPSTDGVELTVRHLGGDGPPLLLCHATGFHGMVWGPVAERLAGRLAGRFTCHALDFRAHGGSTRPQGAALHWEAFGEDVLAVVDGLGLTAPFGVGHSKGAAALLLAELARPGTFRALYLYEPVAFPAGHGDPGAENPVAEGALRRRDVFASRGEACAHFAAKPPLDSLAPAALRAYVEHGFADRPDGTVALRCRPADEAEIYRRSGEHRAFERLGDVRTPAVVGCGGRSTAVPPDLARAQVERLGDGRLQTFEDLGHFGPLERPAEVADGIAAAFATAFADD